MCVCASGGGAEGGKGRGVSGERVAETRPSEPLALLLVPVTLSTRMFRQRRHRPPPAPFAALITCHPYVAIPSFPFPFHFGAPGVVVIIDARSHVPSYAQNKGHVHFLHARHPRRRRDKRFVVFTRARARTLPRSPPPKHPVTSASPLLRLPRYTQLNGAARRG